MEKNNGKISRQEYNSLIRKIIIRFSFLPVVLGLLVLLPAGTFDYWQLYVYLAVITLPMIFNLSYFLKNDPQFLVRRSRAVEKEQKQKIIQTVSAFVFLSGYILSGLDKRFGWSNVPFYVEIIAYTVIVSGNLLIFFVFKQNSYASRIIEVDEDQKVISTGLYGLVRHPMYLGVIFMFGAVPVSLGSYYGLIPMAAVPFILVFRLLNEEAVLRQNLPGYNEYCKKVKYRLIPYIW